MQDFSYDPFDPAVMADPLPYYRVLREHYPRLLPGQVGYLRAVAIRRHLGCAGGQRRNVRRLGGHPAARVDPGPPQRRAGRRPAVASAAVSRGLRCADLRRRPAGAQQAVPAESGRATGDPDPRTGQRAARRAVTARDVRSHPGVRRNRRRVRGVRIPGNTSGFGVRGACLGQCGQPRRTRQRRRHRAVAAQLPGLPDPVGEKAACQHFGQPDCRWWTV